MAAFLNTAQYTGSNMFLGRTLNSNTMMYEFGDNSGCPIPVELVDAIGSRTLYYLYFLFKIMPILEKDWNDTRHT